MTSNYPERLDSALTRPGRVDLKIEFTSCDYKMIKDMVKAFYNKTEDCEKIKWLKKVNCTKIRPCEVQAILNDNYDDFDNCILDLLSFCSN